MSAAERSEPGRRPASKARLRLWLRMLGVTRLVEAELRERLRQGFDTTLPRFDVLAALHRSPAGLKMSELSSVLRVSNGNVTGIVDRLVDDGLVVRVPVEGDRRAMLVRLTAQGRGGLRRARRRARGVGGRAARQRSRRRRRPSSSPACSRSATGWSEGGEAMTR